MESSTENIDKKYVVKKMLGKTKASKVYYAVDINTKVNLAIKIFVENKGRYELINTFKKEVEAMQNLNSDYLIRIIDFNENGLHYFPDKETEEIVYIALELAENAELFDFLVEPRKAFSEPYAKYYFIQIIKGLKAMHDVKKAHRDLKTENLFVDGQFNLKIGDLGFAKFIDQEVNEGKFKTKLGTTGYQCPELVQGLSYSGESNDIFACGVILFILVTVKSPFVEADPLKEYYYSEIHKENYDFFWNKHEKNSKIIKNLSSDIKELIIGMIKHKNRWTLDEIINCNWMKKCEIPNDEELLLEMIKRKEYVDKMKEKNGYQTFPYISLKIGGKIIERGDNNLKIILDTYSQRITDSGLLSFEPQKWEDHFSRYCLKYNNFNAEIAFMNFISMILIQDKDAVIELDKDKLSLHAELKYFDLRNNEDDKSFNLLIFDADLFYDLNNKKTIIELTKDSNTCFLSFNNFIDEIANKYIGYEEK